MIAGWAKFTWRTIHNKSRVTKKKLANYDNWRRRSAAQAARRVERIDAEELVDQAARDAKHSRAAVLALDVQLERADLALSSWRAC